MIPWICSLDPRRELITALFCTPENNVRVFLNGALIFGGLGGGADITSCMIGNAFEDVLKCVIQADDGYASLKIVRDYLIAATAKDLSMMISFRPGEDGDVESSYSGVFLESTNQSFDYKEHWPTCSLK
ncbi:Inositol-pentakisphosphate 2-kinase IPK1 [Camellia lanceoleosa]|uniref:Inositol-pentakisphosphate 2-kinase IPK1 n=1 Tax=Camellia lanceoleosa TaxID=1840588 RepID=A0ACC0IQ50_9ERIC|nr:Inositol-pentakisphosphate 2-kinase IPK1 [Camellia lanceoleosa]